MSRDGDLYIAKPGSFFGVYILYNRNPNHEGKIYIGFTVNPARRIRQHNREITGGAWKTGGDRGPWDMVLITHGFPTRLAALQFEWAWQNPLKSKRLKHLSKKSCKETMFSYRIRILCEMLNTGPWKRLPLTIQWLKQEYHENFPVDKQPPLHMPVAWGEIKTAKGDKEKSVTKLSDDNEKTVSNTNVRQAECFTQCDICIDGLNKESCNRILNCIVESCNFKAHTICFSQLFLKQANNESDFVLPILGQCPLCEQEVLWSDIIKQKKYMLDDLEFGDSQDEDDEEEDSDMY